MKKFVSLLSAAGIATSLLAGAAVPAVSAPINLPAYTAPQSDVVLAQSNGDIMRKERQLQIDRMQERGVITPEQGRNMREMRRDDRREFRRDFRDDRREFRRDARDDRRDFRRDVRDDRRDMRRVERRGDRYYYNGHRGYREYRRGYREVDGWWFPAAAFIAGAVVTGAMNNNSGTVSSGSAHVRWCQDRYRSYRASDNSFQPYNGPRQQCYSPYS